MRAMMAEPVPVGDLSVGDRLALVNVEPPWEAWVLRLVEIRSNPLSGFDLVVTGRDAAPFVLWERADPELRLWRVLWTRSDHLDAGVVAEAAPEPVLVPA
ncbi:MAG: hypothetical protein ACRD0W_00910 [Acidimicrobiales bacterium]